MKSFAKVDRWNDNEKSFIFMNLSLGAIRGRDQILISYK